MQPCLVPIATVHLRDSWQLLRRLRFFGKEFVHNFLFFFSTYSHVQTTLRTAIVLSVICAPGTAGAQWSVDALATRLHDSNVSRGQLASDVMSDNATKLSVAASRELYAVANSSVALSGDAAIAEYDRYGGLSNASLGAALMGRSKLGIGLTAPQLELSVSAAREAYRATQRSGYRYAAVFSAGRRFSESFDAQLGARYDRRRSDYELRDTPEISGRAFDLQGRSLFAQANLAISDLLLANLGMSVRHGDVVSTALETPITWANANAITPDPVFGEDHYAYRLSGAATQSASMGLSWALNTRSSINGSFADERTRARDGFSYHSKLMAIYYMYSR
jgi:hypothetical protein